MEPWRGLGNLKRKVGECKAEKKPTKIELMEIRKFIAFPFSKSPLSNSSISLGYFRNRIKVLPLKICSQEFTALVGCEILGYFDMFLGGKVHFRLCQTDTFDKLDKGSPPFPNL